MANVIKYNGIDYFTQNGIPCPYVSRGTEYIQFGEIRGVRDVITLSGKISAKLSGSEDCEDYQVLSQKRDVISNAFGQSYKKLIIEENGNSIFERNFVNVIDISFEESNYIGVLDFEISIECFDERLHNEFFGITNPENSTSISKGMDEIYNITHTVSAKGINTQDSIPAQENITTHSSALQNAIDFVESISTEENIIKPEGDEDIILYLISESENINRLTNEYSITRTYQSDKNNKTQNQGILKYSTSIEKNYYSQTTNTVNISGDLIFGINDNFSDVRNRFAGINFHNIAELESGEILIDKPVSSTIDENENEKTISFSFLFDNDESFNSCGISNKPTYSISSSGENIKVQVDGIVSARGPVEKRFQLVKDEFYLNIINDIYSNAKAELEKYYPTKNPIVESTSCPQYYDSPELLSSPVDFSVQENEKEGTIQYNYSFINSNIPDGFSSFNSSISINPRTPRFSIDFNAGGGMNKYLISRSGFNVGSISVTIGGVYRNINKSQAIEKIETEKDKIFEETECKLMFGTKGVIVEESIDETDQFNQITLNITKKYYNILV